MPSNDHRNWNTNSEAFVDGMTSLFKKVMVDYEQPDNGLSKEDAVKHFNRLMSISWPWEWVKGRYIPTREWKWIEEIDTASPA